MSKVCLMNCDPGRAWEKELCESINGIILEVFLVGENLGTKWEVEVLLNEDYQNCGRSSLRRWAAI